MPRRASSNIHPGILAAIGIVIIIAIFAGKSLLGKKTASFGDVPMLSVSELLENGNSLRGNEYVIEGQIDEKLATTDHSQVVSVKVSVPGGNEFIGIEIPIQIAKQNIDIKQKYLFRLKFRDGGIPVATGLSRL